jgi:hypothetical protein
VAEERPVRRFLRRVVSFGLGEPAPEPMDLREGIWGSALAGLVREKLTGIAVAALQNGALRLSDEEAAQLLDRHQTVMRHALTLERRLLRLARAFEDEGLELIVLKGPAVAHTMYPDPSWRPFGDLDILVRSGDWRRACSLLSELGYRRKFPEPRPGFVERFGHTAAHVADDGLEVDLHRRLVGGPFGLWMEPEELFDHTEVFELGGRVLRRLDDTALLMHAFVHASLGHRPPLLLSLRDIAQVASGGAIDRARLEDWGRRWKLAVVYRHASHQVSRTLGARVPEALAPGPDGKPLRRERRALEAYTTVRRNRGGKALSSLRAIRGFRDKAAYVSGLLFPGREFLEVRSAGSRRPTRAGRWLMLVRQLRHRP